MHLCTYIIKHNPIIPLSGHVFLNCMRIPSLLKMQALRRLSLFSEINLTAKRKYESTKKEKYDGEKEGIINDKAKFHGLFQIRNFYAPQML